MSDVATAPWQTAVLRVRAALPRGGALPEGAWSARHHGITALLWAHVALLVPVGLWRGVAPESVVVETVIVAAFALAAMPARFGRTLRSSFATIGLFSCSVILVQFFDGLIELHFHFFVIVAVIALYQAWPPYLLGLAIVLFHHAVIGTVAPEFVYNHHAATHNPALFALVHGGFIVAESIACLAYWKVSEDALDGQRSALASLNKVHRDLARAQELSGIGSWHWELATGVVTWSDQHFVLAGVRQATFTPSISSFTGLVHPDDRERVDALMDVAFHTHAPLDYEFRLLRPSGEVRNVHALGEVQLGSDGRPARYFGTSHDVTAQRALQGEIEHMAFHDSLTGLPNRRLFLDRLGHALAVADRSGRPCAVLFLDLDGFKTVNDTFGHPTGDQLLCEVARRLIAAARAADCVARFGGDEFALLCEDVAADAVVEVAERIRRHLSEPFELSGAPIAVQASIGIAMAETGLSAEDILQDADAAMYAAKVGGKDAYRMFPLTSLA